MAIENSGTQTSPFETSIVGLARKGLNLLSATDQLDAEQARILVNLWPNQVGRWRQRPGAQLFGTTGGAEHVSTMRRLNLLNATHTKFWKVGTDIRRGISVADGIPVIDSGYSDDPVVMVPARPQLSGDSWMFIADKNKMRQFSGTGGPQGIGQPAPATAATAGIGDILTTKICDFDSGDSTEASQWTGTAGFDRGENPVLADTPAAADVPGLQGNCVEFTTSPGTAAAGYLSILGTPRSLDLTVLQGGLFPAAPEDLTHLWMRLDRPEFVEEIRVYLVCGQSFAANIVPGTSATANVDAFVKAFRPHDFTSFIEGLQDALGAGAFSRQNDLLKGFLDDASLQTTLPESNPPLSADGPLAGDTAFSVTAGDAGRNTQAGEQFSPGRSVWSEFGVLGKPLRRVEWMRIGSTPEAGWGTITGIIITIQTLVPQPVKLSCDDWFLHGGFALDSSEPDATPYDWRYTNYNLDTGDEGNPSPTMDETNFVQATRQRCNVQVAAAGNSRVRQRVYRRGGSNPSDWNFVGQNASDGALFVDTVSDETAAAAPSLALDNDQPVTTVDSAGSTVRAQPIPQLFGPLGGRMFGCGDPKRPGFLYWSKADRFGAWPPQNTYEVCSSSEQLQAGILFAGEGFLFSRLKMYRVTPNLTGADSVSVQDTPNMAGLASPWGLCEGPDAIYYVAKDGIRRTTGGASELISQQIRPIFFGEQADGSVLPPIDWEEPRAPRLVYYQQQLIFSYFATNDNSTALIYDFTQQLWHQWDFLFDPAAFFSEEQDARNGFPRLFYGGIGNGAVFELKPTYMLDDGIGATASQAITWRVATGYLDGGMPRDDKELGDVILDAGIPDGGDVLLTTRLNTGVLVNGQMTAGNAADAGLGARRRWHFEPFGTTPQFCRNLQLDWTGTHPATATTDTQLYFAGVSARVIAEQVVKRATTWDVIDGQTEVYLTGCSLIADTNGQDVLCMVEITQGTLRTAAAVVTINAPSRRRLQFSWPVVKAEQIRLVPMGGDCTFWRLYAVDWYFEKEPPRISGWDSNWLNKRDTYYTGLDLEVDTLGQEKRVEVWVDQTRLTNPATGLGYFPVTAAGRRLVHLTFGPGRGHVYRFVAVDANPGLLYSHFWHLEDEPSEQTNWNQNFTVEGTLGDKYVKGVLLECDTFGQTKVVQVQIDGVVATTLSINQDGRGVQQFAFPQALGRVLRFLPVDTNPGRLYSLQWIFDEEPLKLTRWETQLLDHGVAGWQVPFCGYFSLRSTADVALDILVYNQEGLLTATRTYTVPSTGDVKTKRYVQFQADKGVFFKYVFRDLGDPALGFYLYRPESSVEIYPWGSPEPLPVRPFGDDDLDKVRSLARATAIAGAV